MKAIRVDVAEGKYSVIIDGGKMTVLLYGERWGRDFTGDMFVYCLAAELDEARTELEQAKKDADRWSEASAQLSADCISMQYERDAIATAVRESNAVITMLTSERDAALADANRLRTKLRDFLTHYQTGDGKRRADLVLNALDALVATEETP